MNKLKYIFLLFSTVFSYGQVILLSKTEEKEFKVHQKFTVNFLLEISGDNMVQESPLGLPDFSKFDVIANGSDQNTVVTGDVIVNQLVVQYVLAPKQTGKIKIGSVTVKVNGKYYKSEPFDIFVKEADKNSVVADHAKNDLYLNVELEKKEVYKNQPTLAVLKAYSKNFNNFRKIKEIKLPKQGNIEVQPISYTKSEIETTNSALASQVLAVFLIYPNQIGNLEISPASATISNHQNKLLSNKARLKVNNLPKNVSSEDHNAVGNFDLDLYTLSIDKVEINQPLQITIKLSGEGNFNTIEIPTLMPSNDYEVFPPKIIQKTVSTEQGTKGEITANYIVIPKKSGPIKVGTKEFTYFNPTERKYVSLASKDLNILALSHDEVLRERTALERVNEYTNNVLETVDNPVIKTQTLKIEKKKALNFSTILINLTLLILLFSLFYILHNIQKNRNKTKNNITPSTVGSLQETEELIREKISGVKVEDTIVYLEKLKSDSNYNEFFASISELDDAIKRNYIKENDHDIISEIEQKKGAKIAEDYRRIQQKIAIEKYAPIIQHEQLDELLNEIKILYPKIIK